MRYPLYILLYVFTCVVQALAEISASAGPSVNISSPHGTAVASYPSGSGSIHSGHLNEYTTARPRSWLSKMRGRGSQASPMTYWMAPRRHVPLRPRGSRTALVGNKFTAYSTPQDALPPASKVQVYMPPAVDPFRVMSLWTLHFVFAAMFAGSLLPTLEVSKKAIRNLWHLHLRTPLLIWQLLLVPLAKTPYRVGLACCQILDFAIWSLCFIARSPWYLFKCLFSLITLWKTWRNRRRAQQQLRDCIKRKAATPDASPEPALIEQTKFSATPFFTPEEFDKVVPLELPDNILPIDREVQASVCNPRHFNLVRQVGAGSFGSVLQIEDRITGRMLAIKKLEEEKNTPREIKQEIESMARMQSGNVGLKGVWYPRLYGSFRDRDSFYLLMPFYESGDLLALAIKYGGCLPRPLARFYLAELLLGIQGLHHMGIVHRDLKPDNILFTSCGHLVIADFGVAYLFRSDDEDHPFYEDEFPLWWDRKAAGGDDFPLLTPSVDNPDIRHDTVGTTYYSAPEVDQGRDYSYGVDYYSMGMLFHEMITGYVPLHVEAPIRDGEEPRVHLNLDRKDCHLQQVSPIEMDFLTKVLDNDPFARLSVKSMKTHPIFAGVDWTKIAQREVPIPPCSQTIRKRVPVDHSSLD